jgi:hypothetical protein
LGLELQDAIPLANRCGERHDRAAPDDRARCAQGVEDDGRSLWVALYKASLVLRVDRATGKIQKSYKVGQLPRGLTVALGSVWVANSASGTISRIGLSH